MRLASMQRYCNDLSTVSESVRLMKILSCESRQTVGSLRKRRSAEPWTVTREESLNLLVSVHFLEDGLDHEPPSTETFQTPVIGSRQAQLFHGDWARWYLRICFRKALVSFPLLENDIQTYSSSRIDTPWKLGGRLRWFVSLKRVKKSTELPNHRSIWKYSCHKFLLQKPPLS